MLGEIPFDPGIIKNVWDFSAGVAELLTRFYDARYCVVDQNLSLFCNLQE
jgi:hypothetical protein